VFTIVNTDIIFLLIKIDVVRLQVFTIVNTDIIFLLIKIAVVRLQVFTIVNTDIFTYQNSCCQITSVYNRKH
jgi:hypothetical protein